MKKAFASFVIVLLYASALILPIPSQARNTPVNVVSAQGVRFVPGEVLIRFKAFADESDKTAARKIVGALRKEKIETAVERFYEKGDLELTQFPEGLSIDDVILALQSHPAVEFVEPNWIYTHATTSNDPYYTNGSLWGMYGDGTTPANQYGSQAGEAWAAGHTGSSNVYIGVIDEGIDYRHPDLSANIWTNPYDGVDGVDNDGNGYVDDTRGWDFDGNNNSVYDGTAADNTIDEHGTHVSGTIGGVGGNGAGVAGVNWNVTIISGKFLGTGGGTSANAVKAVNYFTDLKTRHNLNIVATSNSWGGGGYSQSLHDAIIRGAKQDILFIAAAGNGDILGRPINNDTTANYPSNYNTAQGTSTETAASYDAVVAVASITSTGAKSSFSNYGATTVDLGAPGSGINSTTPNGTYSSFSGTSMATPHVSGAAALYASINLGSSALTIRNALLDSARQTPTTSLSNITVTGGRLNVSTFVSGGTPPPPPPPSTVPAAPSNLSASAVSRSQINLSWADNSDNESGFRIERCTGAGCSNFAQIADVGADVRSYSNTGLARSTTYTYRVHAYNSAGNSGYSNTPSTTTPRK